MASAWDEIVDVIGHELAHSLVRMMPGQSRRIPFKPNLWLQTKLGHDGAQRLCEALGGEIVSIPSSMARESSIRAMRATGATINEIASRHFIHERTVRRILKRDHQPIHSSQMELLL